jgi:hypothetical protein
MPRICIVCFVQQSLWGNFITFWSMSHLQIWQDHQEGNTIHCGIWGWEGIILFSVMENYCVDNPVMPTILRALFSSSMKILSIYIHLFTLPINLLCLWTRSIISWVILVTSGDNWSQCFFLLQCFSCFQIPTLFNFVLTQWRNRWKTQNTRSTCLLICLDIFTLYNLIIEIRVSNEFVLYLRCYCCPIWIAYCDALWVLQ